MLFGTFAVSLNEKHRDRTESLTDSSTLTDVVSKSVIESVDSLDIPRVNKAVSQYSVACLSYWVRIGLLLYPVADLFSDRLTDECTESLSLQ